MDADGGRAVRIVVGQDGVLEIVAGEGRCRRAAVAGRWLGELRIQVLTPSAMTASSVNNRKATQRPPPARARRIASHSSRTAPAPPGRYSSSARPTSPADAHPPPQPRSRRPTSAADRVCHRRYRPRPCDRSELACEVGERGHFVAASLHEVPYAKLPHARRHGGRAPAAYRCDRDAAQHEKLDAVPIAYVKHLELLTPGREVEAPVGQDTVDIEH